MNEATPNDNLGGAPAPQATGITPNNTQAVSDTSSAAAPKEKLLGKFDTVDDVLKGYTELEKKLGKVKTLEEEAAILQEIAESTQLDKKTLREQARMLRAEREGKGPIAPVQDPNIAKYNAELGVKVTKMQFAQEAQEVFQERPELKQVQSQLMDLYLSKGGDTSLREIADEFYSPVINNVRDAAAKKIQEKAAANSQSAQGSGPQITDEYKRARDLASRTGSVEDVAKMLEAIG